MQGANPHLPCVSAAAGRRGVGASKVRRDTETEEHLPAVNERRQVGCPSKDGKWNWGLARHENRHLRVPSESNTNPSLPLAWSDAVILARYCEFRTRSGQVAKRLGDNGRGLPSKGLVAGDTPKLAR